MARQKTKVKVYQEGKDGIIIPTEIGEANSLAEARKIPNESGVYEYHRVVAKETVEVKQVKKIERKRLEE